MMSLKGSCTSIVFKYPKVFQCEKGLSLEVIRQSCLRDTRLTFEQQQQNTSTLTQLLWKPLKKGWKNSCFSA